MTTKLMDYTALTPDKGESNSRRPPDDKRRGQTLSMSICHVSVVQRVQSGLTIGLAVLAPLWMVADASASTVVGSPTFVGKTFTDSKLPSALVRVRIGEGTCDGGNVENFWVDVSSGDLTGAFAERNSLNMKNAYSTLLIALLSGKMIQIDGLESCTPSSIVDLSNGTLGLF